MFSLKPALFRGDDVSMNRKKGTTATTKVFVKHVDNSLMKFAKNYVKLSNEKHF
jgi:hypothetical protein